MCNERSSRSHSIFQIRLDRSTLNLIDLAGSERLNTTKVSGGRILFAGTDNQANTTSGVESVLNSDFYLGSSIAGASDIVVIGVQRLTGTTETFYGSINWKDQQ
jgi:hypothetical protein